VVAVVGDTVLLLSNVQDEVAARLADPAQTPPDSVGLEALARTVLDRQLNDLVIIAAAKQAGTTVPEDMVTSAVEERWALVRSNFPTEQALDQALAREGETREIYRRKLQEQERNSLMVRQFLSGEAAKQARPVIDESAIVAFWEEHRAAQPPRPATISFRQVVVTPQMSDSARLAAVNQALEVRRELATGADFAVLARRFSDDPGTKDRGGDLGWFRAGQGLTPSFEQAAFAMRAGETSGIVESPFGFHIIRVERTRGAERQIRHILVAPDITEADVERARVRADSILQAVQGGASMATLASRYNGPDDLPNVTRHPVDQLPVEYATIIGQSTTGSILGPLRLEDRGSVRWAVIQVTERQEAGPRTLDDVRENIRESLEQEALMEQIVADLRTRVYVSEPRLGPVRPSLYLGPTN
jgi:peptidyl-prolyl cis-trans isomerase SurA